MTTDKTGAPTTVTQESDRFSIAVDGQKVGFTEYADRDGQRIFPHTEVSDDYNERASLPLMGFAYVPSGTDKLHLQCKDDGGIGGDLNDLNNIKVIAQSVGGYSALAN